MSIGLQDLVKDCNEALQRSNNALDMLVEEQCRLLPLMDSNTPAASLSERLWPGTVRFLSSAPSEKYKCALCSQVATINRGNVKTNVRKLCFAPCIRIVVCDHCVNHVYL